MVPLHGCPPNPEVTDMSNANTLPLDLYKANLELQVRIGKLFQEGGKQWLDYGYRLASDVIAESDAEIAQLLQSEDWQKLATLPAEAFWRQLQQRLGDSQAAAQIAITAQTGFAHGLQEAVQAWQQQTAGVLGEVAPAALSGGDSPWANLFKPWQQLLQAAATDTPAAVGPAAKGRK